MKKIILIVACALACIAIDAKEIKKVIFTTQPQMTCENCENNIKGNLRFEKGVKDIVTDLADQEVVVTYDADKTDVEALKKGFLKIGYNAVVKAGTSEELQSQQPEVQDSKKARRSLNDSTAQVKKALPEAAGFCEDGTRKKTKANSLAGARIARQATCNQQAKECSGAQKECTKQAGECTKEKKECAKGKECSKEKKECTKEKKECIKEKKECCKEKK